MTAMDELTGFITARLDEDEAVAKAAAGDGPEWTVRSHPADSAMIRDNEGLVLIYDEGTPTDKEAAHIARHDPARVLREVEAKRAIATMHQPYDCMEPKGQRCHRCASDKAYKSGAAIHEAWPCPTLRALAAAWSDHPDYRPEWTPAP